MTVHYVMTQVFCIHGNQIFLDYPGFHCNGHDLCKVLVLSILHNCI